MTPGYAFCGGCREWAINALPGEKWWYAPELTGFTIPRHDMCRDCAYELADEIAETLGRDVADKWLDSCRQEDIDRKAITFGDSIP